MLGPGGFLCIAVFNDNVCGKLGQLHKVRTNMDMRSVEGYFWVAQPSIKPKPTKIVGKENQEFNRGGRELTTYLDLITIKR